MAEVMETDSDERLAAYRKYLSAFKKALVSKMAAHFKKEVQEIMSDIEDYITAGELSYRINGVEGYIEHYKPDVKSELIQDVIRESALLIDNIHRKVEMVRSERKEE